MHTHTRADIERSTHITPSTSPIAMLTLLALVLAGPAVTLADEGDETPAGPALAPGDAAEGSGEQSTPLQDGDTSHDGDPDATGRDSEDAAEDDDGSSDAGEKSDADADPEPDPKVLVKGSSGSFVNKPGHWFALKASLEFGFTGIIWHKIRLGDGGTWFDYKNEGNQDNLFFFTRMSGEFEIVDRHSLIFLYQPLDLETQTVARRDVLMAGASFPDGTPMELRYGFDFYRFSYLYDFFKDPDIEVAIGLGLQIRNATIVFTSADGAIRGIRSDVGPVPLLKVRGKYTFSPGVWIGLEVDGFWAGTKYLNGSDTDFEGSILDAALRVGFNITPWFDTFVTVRYIGGGARGDDDDAEGSGGGSTRNWLHLMTLSLGVSLK